MSDRLHGIIPYLVSPINESTGDVKTDVLYNLSTDLIEKGVNGLSPLGSAGEVHYLNWEQKKTIVTTVLQASNGSVPVIAGVATFSPEEAIKQINHYERLGVDGVVLNLNTYFKLNSAEIIRFIQTVANAVSCEIILYNNPKFSNVDLSPDIIIELAKINNVNYFKDATGDTGRLLTIMNQTTDIDIFSASAHVPLSVMQLGGVGWMAGPACVFPKESVFLYELTLSKEWDKAIKVQKILWGINELFKQYTPASSIKASLEGIGYDVGDSLSPMTPLNDVDKNNISQWLEEINFKFKQFNNQIYV